MDELLKRLEHLLTGGEFREQYPGERAEAIELLEAQLDMAIEMDRRRSEMRVPFERPSEAYSGAEEKRW